MRLLLLTLLFIAAAGNGLAQHRQPKPVVKDSLSSDVFIDLVEKTLFDYYGEIANLPNSETIFNDLEKETRDDISDQEICERIKAMNELSEFKFDCNAITVEAIKTFIRTRKSFVRICMGRSSLYFDMYEEYLHKYELPKNLKYLSVIESALSPQIKSRAGALGLWQFMYGTGKLYGLKDNSYFDERMDPRKATDAACRYLKKLHDIYNDWNLALAAYNAGPGNINRAIRRAGGKVSYWAVRPFLPKETQQYVPRFIAATYLFVYAKQHGVTAAPSAYRYYQLDTMCLKKGVRMNTISDLIGWGADSIRYFNPVYKGTYIPKTEPNQCITGPLTYIGRLVSLEDSLYKMTNDIDKIEDNNTLDPDNIYPLNTTEVYELHTVKSGETLTNIAAKYNVSLTLIKQENNLTTNTVKVGQELKIPRKVISSVQTTGIEIQTFVDTVYFDTLVERIHVVQRNENMDVISKIHGVSKDSIIKWNGLKDEWINIGQKLSVFKIEQIYRLEQNTAPVNTSVPNAAQQPKPAIPKPAVPAASKPQYHVVRSGELFNRIAGKYNLTQAQLQKLNPNVNPNRIAVGQKLRVK
ncbi:MAG: LysM peptidoglycan-binding domain-containing protein [Flavobacteriia bacterium]|nr:LysM peptidoglycan-binding domain-containing protein [Flavobacteriia bacterium]OJX37264.1 MAG: hypothetical protein BGO87_01075 [Flavobacteriia bacterium 40-80]